MPVIDDVIQAFKNLGGRGRLSEIYIEVRKICAARGHSGWAHSSIRLNIQHCSPKAKRFKGENGLFQWIGNGHWELREYVEKPTVFLEKPPISPVAVDLKEPSKTLRKETTIYRVLRDTEIARCAKQIHENRCQICKKRILLSDGSFYSEAHHIRPLGLPHSGPDSLDNILVLCPNHHVECDYGTIKLDLKNLKQEGNHIINQTYVDYHNHEVFRTC
jgi:hypothetical protein